MLGYPKLGRVTFQNVFLIYVYWLIENVEKVIFLTGQVEKPDPTQAFYLIRWRLRPKGLNDVPKVPQQSGNKDTTTTLPAWPPVLELCLLYHTMLAFWILLTSTFCYCEMGKFTSLELLDRLTIRNKWEKVCEKFSHVNLYVKNINTSHLHEVCEKVFGSSSISLIQIHGLKISGCYSNFRKLFS